MTAPASRSATPPAPTAQEQRPRLTRARRTALLKALADPKRFELLERIARAGCPLGCTQAKSALAISPATLSHHVKELETAGLIRVERAGKFHFLHLQPDVLAALSQMLGALAQPGCAPQQTHLCKKSSTLLNPFARLRNQFDSYRNVEMMAFRSRRSKMKNLQGKVALVTGASKGIGAAIAKELASRGAAVAVNYSGSKEAAEKVVSEIKAAGGKAVAVQANLAHADAAAPLVEKVAKELGPIDVLVNNAGIYEFGPLESITADHFHRQFNLNVLGLLLTTQAAVKNFSPAGGSVINISSVVVDGVAGASVYSATKGAVDTITAALSKELGPKRIRVNSINPGLIETEGTHAAGFIDSEFHKEAVQRTPLGRTGQPQDIATAAAFLASDDSVWVNGQSIYAAGGFTL